MTDEELMWSVKKSEELLHTPIFDVEKRNEESATGIVGDYMVINATEWVTIIPVYKGNFVLVRQYRHGLGNTCYELPCGVIEKGETPLQAAQRELLEETGYAGGTWKEWMTLSPNPATSNNLAHSFLALGVKKVSGQHLDATEDIDVYLKRPEFVRQLLEENQILQALMAAPLWKYFSSL